MQMQKQILAKREDVALKGLVSKTYEGLDIAYLKKVKAAYCDYFNQGGMVQTNYRHTNETILLQHGTSTSYLNAILTEGLTPSTTNNNDNWEHIESEKFDPLFNCVYVTNKWHLFYATHTATDISFPYFDKLGLEWQKHYEKSNAFPCFLTLELPMAKLIPDEDAFLSSYMESFLKESLGDSYGEIPDFEKLVFDMDGLLSNYGTAAYEGVVPPNQLKSVTLMGSLDFLVGTYLPYTSDFAHKVSDYMKDFTYFQKGFGFGAMSIDDVNTFLCSFDCLKTYEIENIKGQVISGVNLRKNKISFHFSKQKKLDR